MSMRYTSLKALQRPPRLAPDESTAPTLLGVDGISRHTVRPNVERLAQVLGATTKTNQYGEFLSVRCWCAQPPSFSPDLRALKLLLPNAPEEIADPGEWLFLDTETTGLSGGSGTPDSDPSSPEYHHSRRERGHGSRSDEPVCRQSEMADLSSADHVALRDEQARRPDGAPRRSVLLLLS